MATQRKAIWISGIRANDGLGGYIPSVVTEGEIGSTLLSGDGEFSQPWEWGTDIAQAQQLADKANEQLGLTPENVRAILHSANVCSCYNDTSES